MSFMTVNQVMRYKPPGEVWDDQRPQVESPETVEDPAGLTRMQREHLGFVTRLDLPLDNSRNLRRYAEHLRGLADALDFISRRTDLKEYELLQEARFAADKVRRVFLELYPTRERRFPTK